MKASRARSRATKAQSAEDKLIAVIERRVEELEQSNAKLLRLVELAMEDKFYRPVITGGVRENVIAPSLPIETLNDVATYDGQADAKQSREQFQAYAELEKELREIEAEQQDWRAGKGLANEETLVTASV